MKSKETTTVLGFKRYVYTQNYPAYERENVNWKYAFKKQVVIN